MIIARVARIALIGGLAVTLAACGGGFGSGGSLFGGGRRAAAPANLPDPAVQAAQEKASGREGDRNQNSIWDLFSNASDPNTTVEVNKYLWQASLEVLNFLPIESVDPFTGVIVTGYGRPPGAGRAYRATVYVQDPALDARSLKVALQSQGGAPVSTETARAVEDAILTRARQLRVRDAGL
ncbi:MAG: DUF3576 domain-containing protein [Pseudomonadota bacterium]